MGAKFIQDCPLDIMLSPPNNYPSLFREVIETISALHFIQPFLVCLFLKEGECYT